MEPKLGGGAKPSHKTSLPARHSPRRISVEELRENFKRKLSLPKEKDILPAFDPLEKAQNSIDKVRGKTGVIFDESVFEHFCLWDSAYPENPERLMCILRRCRELDLFSQCEILEPTVATPEYVQMYHSKHLFDTLRATEFLTDPDDLEEIASNYEAVYIHPKTFKSSLIAAGSTLEIMKAVLDDKVQNGFALIRPPGHHAMVDGFCGYCYFNNVALAARYAIDNLNLERILIVDWDVHHGQGTQQCFYNDPRVLYFSSHRYEHGHFWPWLRESEFDFIGTGKGEGYNFNIPLNKIGLGNGDFLCYFHQILLPVAYEYNPQLVLVSAGYDAAIGCPEGKMKLTPAFYAHLTSMLMTLANGKLVVVLEGGYCPDSLSEAAIHTLRTLMGSPCPPLLDGVEPPSLSMKETILNVIYTHKAFWKSLQYQENEKPSIRMPLHVPKIISRHPPPIIGKYPTRVIHESYLEDELTPLLERLQKLKEGTSIKICHNRVCLVYDEAMEKHINLMEKNFPERPARTQEILKRLKEFGILDRVHRLKSRRATVEEVQLVHSPVLIQLLKESECMSPRERHKLENDFVSIYFHESTCEAAFLATGCLLQVVDSVCSKESQSGVAIIRPPGHHAEVAEPYGFCLFNNVAIATMYALQKYSLERILILDWDIHHGNGIQRVFESDPRVLYISIHLYRNANFFPYSEEANSNFVGIGRGRGFNINIPWSKNGMKDGDYIAAFTQVVMPVAYEFDPQLVIVSAGFDAAIHDPLGGCCVTPEGFGHMTQLLSSLANGHVILALEGGYNLASISYSMTLCTKVLLGDPLPPLADNLVPSKSAVEVIKEVIHTQKEFWPSLCFEVAFPNRSGFTLVELKEDWSEGSRDTTPSQESDSGFLTPPQTPENYSLKFPRSSFSPDADAAIDSIVSDLSALSVSDSSKVTSLKMRDMECMASSPLVDSKVTSLKMSDMECMSSSPLVDSKVTSLKMSDMEGMSSSPLVNSKVTSLKRSDMEGMSSSPLVNSKVTSLKRSDMECMSSSPLVDSRKVFDKPFVEMSKSDSSQAGLIQPYFCVETSPSNDPKPGPSNESGASSPNGGNNVFRGLEGAVGGSEQQSFTIEQILAGQREMYAVVPLTYCPHLVEVRPVPAGGLDAFAPCEECFDLTENWVCLICYLVMCGRYVEEHMIHHSLGMDHHIVLSYADLSVWCYACESYVDNEVLTEAKEAASRSKFGGSARS